MFVKHQVNLKLHFLDLVLKPVFVKTEVEERGLRAKLTQFSFLFFTYRNLKYVS